MIVFGIFQKIKVRTSLTLAIILLISTELYSQKIEYRGFSGGMMINSGYMTSDIFTITNSTGTLISSQKTEGTSFGLGGAIKIHLTDHFRAGAEGYVSTLHYDNNGSFASISWGGFLLDWIWQLGKVSPYLGACIGGGSQKNLTMNEHFSDDYIIENDISFRKYSFMVVTPYIGLELTLNDKVKLVFKADYLMNVSNPQKDFMKGVRCFIGFSFYKLKE